MHFDLKIPRIPQIQLIEDRLEDRYKHHIGSIRGKNEFFLPNLTKDNLPLHRLWNLPHHQMLVDIQLDRTLT